MSTHLSNGQLAGRCLGAMVVFVVSHAACGATWNQTAGGTYDWNDDANWTSPAIFPGAIDAVANITADFAATQTINLNTAITVGSLTINDTGASGDSAITIAPNSGSFTFEVSSGNAGLTISSACTINAPIAFNSPTTISNAATLALGGNLSGSVTLTKAGGGQLNLTGSNSGFTGKWIINGSSSGNLLNITNDSQLGAVPSSPVADYFTVSGPGGLLFSTTINANRGITIVSGKTFTVRTGSTTGAAIIAGDITGAGSMQMTGTSSSSIITLSGANDYTGNTTITLGTLRAGSTSAFGSNSAVTLTQTGSGKVALALNDFNNTIGSLAGTKTGSGTIEMTLGSATLTTGGNNTSTDFVGVISGTGGLIKTGIGTQTLSGDNTYTGPTTINGGVLNVTGSLADTAVTVNVGGTLGGTGTINGAVSVVGGTLAPGNSPGTLILGSDLSLDANSVLSFDLNAADQTVGSNINDLIDMTSAASTLTLDGTLNVTSAALGAGTWTLFAYTGNLTNNGLALGFVPVASGYHADIVAGSGTVDLVITAIPEPASLALLAVGGLVTFRRRR